MNNRTGLSLIFLVLGVVAVVAPANDDSPIRLGEVLPEVQLAGDTVGALAIVDGRIHYEPWSTRDLTGKPRIVYHLAARPGIDKIHAALFAALSDLQIDPDTFVTLTLLNGDDVSFGVTGIARSEFEKNKRKYPAGEFVFDGDSSAQRRWQLARKSSAVILVDDRGRVLFFKDGPLSDEETRGLIEQVKQVSGYQR